MHRQLTYTCHMAARQGEPSSAKPGESRWINAVAMITPEPKYFANLFLFYLSARGVQQGQARGMENDQCMQVANAIHEEGDTKKGRDFTKYKRETDS
jgi:hypothetical protein